MKGNTSVKKLALQSLETIGPTLSFRKKILSPESQHGGRSNDFIRIYTMTYGYQQTERRTLKNTAITVARGDWEHPRVRIDLQNGLQSLSALNNKVLLLKQGAAFCKNLEFQVCFGGHLKQIEHHLLCAMTSSRGNFDALSAFPFSAFDDSNLLFLLTLDRLLMNPATGFSNLPGTCIHTKWIEDERTPPYPKYPKAAAWG